MIFISNFNFKIISNNYSVRNPLHYTLKKILEKYWELKHSQVSSVTF